MREVIPGLVCIGNTHDAQNVAGVFENIHAQN